MPLESGLSFGRATVFGVLIWFVGFVWGSVVFMTSALKSISPIRYISNNPAISFPILLAWFFLALFLARRFSKPVESQSGNGIRLGLVFFVTNILPDLSVLVFALKAGFGYFASLTVRVGYAMLLTIPIFVGRQMQKET